jgi:hypothetical protein
MHICPSNGSKTGTAQGGFNLKRPNQSPLVESTRMCRGELIVEVILPLTPSPDLMSNTEP